MKVAYLITLLAQAAAIFIGLMLLRQGRATTASGVFIGLLVILGLRVISSVLRRSTGGCGRPLSSLASRRWSALPFLEQGAAKRQET